MDEAMTTEEFMKKAFPALIEATGDPLAPIKLQEAHKFANLVGEMLTLKADQGKVNAISDHMLNGIEPLCLPHDPEFLISLAAMFITTIETYTLKVAGSPRS